MPDRITQLERLNRLRAEGGLSDEEFGREKQRLFSGRSKGIWMLAASTIALAAIVVALLVLFLGRGGTEEKADIASVASTRSENIASPAKSTPLQPPAAAPLPLDISSRIGIADGSCRFAPNLEQAFQNMLHSDGNRVRPLPVRFGTMRLTPSLTSSRDEGVNLPNYRSYESVVSFPVPVTWNGLRVTGLRAATGWEWEWQSMEFADGPARVRAALQGMGIRIPASGNLELPAEACPGYIGVGARGRGSTLSCGGSC
jgi:hypothetical protein